MFCFSAPTRPCIVPPLTFSSSCASMPGGRADATASRKTSVLLDGGDGASLSDSASGGSGGDGGGGGGVFSGGDGGGSSGCSCSLAGSSGGGGSRVARGANTSAAATSASASVIMSRPCSAACARAQRSAIKGARTESMPNASAVSHSAAIHESSTLTDISRCLASRAWRSHEASAGSSAASSRASAAEPRMRTTKASRSRSAACTDSSSIDSSITMAQMRAA